MKLNKLFAFILLSILGLISNAKGQDSLLMKVSKHKNIWIGFNISPDLNFRNLVVLGDSMALSKSIYNRRVGERIKFGYSFGLGLLINVSNKSALETGLQYSNKGYQSEWWPGNGNERAKNIYYLHYLDFSIKYNVVFGQKRLKFLIGSGLVTNVLIFKGFASVSREKDGVVQRINYPIYDIAGQSGTTISFVSNIGVSVNIKENNILKIEPTFKYAIFDFVGISIKSPYRQHLWSAGLTIGYYFRCK